MKVKLLLGILLFSFLLCPVKVRSQVVGVKSNLLYWGTTTPNLALELGLGRKTSLDIVGTYNPFVYSDNKKLLHWSVQPELRFWNCERFNRGFFGVHLTGGSYNVGNLDLPFKIFPKLKDYRFEGYMLGGGISYGYQWYLGPHWNLEATFGFGYLYLNYDQYECYKCGNMVVKDKHHYFGPTKLGLSFVYLFKSKR